MARALKNSWALRSFAAAVLVFSFMPAAALSATLVLKGGIDGVVDLSDERTFSVPGGGLNRLSFRYANPASFEGATVSQKISSRRVDYHPKPASVKDETDVYGNTYTTVTWENVSSDVTIKESYTVSRRIKLSEIRSTAPFPLDAASLPADVRRYLAPTKQAQADDPQIKILGASLVKGAAGEQEAVMAVMNWVVDNVKYKTPIPEYGALWTLKTGQGNCQNFAHLAIALLRSQGIPARIVGGVALDKKWKVPLENGALIQGIGQGGHAWMEVWYPDIGWVEYDPQQSHLFVGPRHIKQSVGLDSNDVNDSWRAAPSLPPFNETYAPVYVKDDVALVLKKSYASPGNYIMTASVETVPPSVVAPKPEKPPGAERGAIEFGNTDFPRTLDFLLSSAAGDVGYRSFDKESAEYVTSDITYAQGFTVEASMRLDMVSLAMHRFGGRLGSLWIDVVKDGGGKPGMEGFRSMPLALDSVKYTPGYDWFDFVFSADDAEKPVLAPGEYWIVLRRSKDAIVNWYYTPGNRYGGPDNCRSTASGINWSNVLNYDFNFRVRGFVVVKDTKR